MTRAELQQMVEDVAGKTVSDAIGRFAERRQIPAAAELAAIAPVAERVELGGPGGLVRTEQSLAGERRGVAMGGAFACLAQAKGNLDAAIAIAKGPAWKGMPEVEKILVAGEAVNGGVLIAPEHSQEIIDLLTPRTVVRRHVADVMDVSAGMVDIPRLTSDASVSWGGEIDEIREGAPTFDQVVLRAFQEKVLVPMSNTMLRRGGPRVASIVRNSTVRAMSLGEDQVFLTSPGSEHRPKGLKWWAPAANRLTATPFTGTAAEKLAAVTNDLGRMMLALEEANVPMTAPFWAFSPRTKIYLMTVRDSNGNLVFADEMKNGTLWTIPYESTTRIVRNDGTGANESTIYLADGDELVLGQGASMQIDMSTEGTFVDVDGNVISAFQRNLSLLRIINEVDLKPKHPEAIATLGGVTWA